jgi:hypothetical protein
METPPEASTSISIRRILDHSASVRLRRTSLRLSGRPSALPSRGRAGACRQAGSDLTVCRPERGAVRPQSDPRRRRHSSARCQTGPAAGRQGLEDLAQSQATLRRLPPAAAVPSPAARERKILLSIGLGMTPPPVVMIVLRRPIQIGRRLSTDRPAGREIRLSRPPRSAPGNFPRYVRPARTGSPRTRRPRRRAPAPSGSWTRSGSVRPGHARRCRSPCRSRRPAGSAADR